MLHSGKPCSELNNIAFNFIFLWFSYTHDLIKFLNINIFLFKYIFKVYLNSSPIGT